MTMKTTILTHRLPFRARSVYLRSADGVPIHCWCHGSLPSPCHRQRWYWQWWINCSLSSTRNDLNHLAILVWRNDGKWKYIFVFTKKNSAPIRVSRFLYLTVITIWYVSFFPYVKSLWPSDAIWRHRAGSTLVDVIPCCLSASRPYLNQCWLITNMVVWHSPEDNSNGNVPDINHWIQITTPLGSVYWHDYQLYCCCVGRPCASYMYVRQD